MQHKNIYLCCSRICRVVAQQHALGVAVRNKQQIEIMERTATNKAKLFLGSVNNATTTKTTATKTAIHRQDL